MAAAVSALASSCKSFQESPTAAVRATGLPAAAREQPPGGLSLAALEARLASPLSPPAAADPCPAAQAAERFAAGSACTQ